VLPNWLVFVAVALRLCGGLAYVYDIVAKNARPNPITWFSWSLAGLVAFTAQLAEGVGIQSLTTLAIGLSPLAIFIASLAKSRDASSFTATNIVCGILAVTGIVLWVVTDNPILAIVFSILGDIAGGVPTITKAFNRPDSEPKKPYLFTMASMVITTLTIDHWVFAAYAFPIYIFCINFLILALAYSKIGLRYRACTGMAK
jgi:hypothetical protein